MKDLIVLFDIIFGIKYLIIGNFVMIFIINDVIRFNCFLGDLVF